MQTRCEGLLTGAVGYASLPDGGRLLLPGLLPGETAEFPSVIPRGRRFEGEVDEYNRTFRRGGVSAKARYYDAFTPAYTRASESL